MKNGNTKYFKFRNICQVVKKRSLTFFVIWSKFPSDDHFSKYDLLLHIMWWNQIKNRKVGPRMGKVWKYFLMGETPSFSQVFFPVS